MGQLAQPQNKAASGKPSDLPYEPIAHLKLKTKQVPDEVRVRLPSMLDCALIHSRPSHSTILKVDQDLQFKSTDSSSAATLPLSCKQELGCAQRFLCTASSVRNQKLGSRKAKVWGLPRRDGRALLHFWTVPGETANSMVFLLIQLEGLHLEQGHFGARGKNVFRLIATEVCSA